MSKKSGKSKSAGGPKKAAGGASRASHSVPTIEDIVQDPITGLANDYWAPGSKGKYSGVFDVNVVQSLYHNEIKSNVTSRLQLLEFSGYLENYLWKHYVGDTVCTEHTLSIIYMVNEKFREGLLNTFENLTVEGDDEKFQLFFKKVVLLFNDDLDTSTLIAYVTFLINVFQSLEDPTVRRSTLRYFSLPLWDNLSQSRLSFELDRFPQLKRHWEHLKAEAGAATAEGAASADQPATKKQKKGGAKINATPSPAKPAVVLPVENFDSTWIPGILKKFMDAVEDPAFLSDAAEIKSDVQMLVFIERCAELVVDLLSQLPTRRFLNTLIDDMHLVIRCKRSPLISNPHGRLFSQLVGTIDSYVHFEVNDQTGQALTARDVLSEQTTRIHKLQKFAFADYKDVLMDLVFSSTGELGKAEALRKNMLLLDNQQIVDLGVKLGYLSARDVAVIAALEAVDSDGVHSFAVDILVDKLAFRKSQIDELNLLSLYPSEQLLWDPNQIPLSSSFKGHQVLSLPKLNLQFLTIHDYLLRNFLLYRLESAYEVREDLVDAIKRMGPREGLRGETTFGGWARMALPITSVSIDEVAKPLLGELIPHRVDCTAEVDISRFTGDIRAEWEALREHDVVFLVCFERPRPDAAAGLSQFESERHDLAQGKKPRNLKDFQWKEENLDFPVRYGVKYVRGGEVFEMRDDANIVLNDPSRPDERASGRVGSKRKIRLHLDPAQYYTDIRDGLECYESFNLLVRRKPEENNFKGILETIRDLMNVAAVGRGIPPWLHDVFLGYGSPGAANYRSLTPARPDGKVVEECDFVDTFLDAQHLVESFPSASIRFETASQKTIAVSQEEFSDFASLPPPPYRLVIERPAAGAAPSSSSKAAEESITVKAYNPLNPGPYPEDYPPKNAVRFTPTQVEAIRSGINPGLTVVVGPPGTGKTDVAVQIICALYHNYPTHKILLVTHSNAALNDLFEKIMKCNVDPRHLLRLGSGERDLREALALAGAGGTGRGQGEEFSKQGRVNWSLNRRSQLLAEVQVLAVSLGVPGDVGYTCETAEYFLLEHIHARIEKFKLDVAKAKATAIAGSVEESTIVQRLFPFTKYFDDVPTALFRGRFAEDMESAEGCFRHINKLFEELADYRAFELLRTQAHRTDYLLTKQARIVAMTCTHAAITRRRLVELGFKYDSLVMEEAAQVLEVETLIPMLLQNTDEVDGCRLKRVVLIGDHYQLPPVVKHVAFQKYAKLDQSLFTRFVRLGVPTVLLDKQGRARQDIASLYSWRYSGLRQRGEHARVLDGLGNLDAVLTEPNYQSANAGFAHTFQLIDVPAFKGRGETCPTPHFFQNLGEAEYVVAMFQYMRLMGYPAEKISIITTYNGQTQLIRDIIQQRCRSPVFGRPARVTTVDKFQGQQNDYILLSLVRTESVGHVRDVRRLVVAMSRARLGLYVFCRKALFENCYELSPTFNQLLSRPPKLQLVVGESFPAVRPAGPLSPETIVHTVEDVTAMGVLVYQLVQQSQHLAAARTAVVPDFARDVKAAATGRMEEAQTAGDGGDGGDSDATGDGEGDDSDDEQAAEVAEEAQMEAADD